MEDQPGPSSVKDKKPASLCELLNLPENQGASLVVPLSWCPHLGDLSKDSRELINTDAPCQICQNVGENWICLVCEGVFCGRYVKEHALIHGAETGHALTLSFSDLSVWCYVCDAYVDNEKLYPFKNWAHKYKFKEEMIKPRYPSDQLELSS